MPVNKEQYQNLLMQAQARRCTVLAVSKTKSVEDILDLYALGQRDFAENYVQELLDKQAVLPQDIRWHFIGHLQTNKVKLIVPVVHLIHGVDSLKVLDEIQKTAAKVNRKVACLLQVHLAQEESTKYGFTPEDIAAVCTAYCSQPSRYSMVSLKGLMGMASLTTDVQKIRHEFASLRNLLEAMRRHYSCLGDSFKELSMGMSSDYAWALEEGSTMLRIGSLLFGAREYGTGH